MCDTLHLHGARYAVGPLASRSGSIAIADGRIVALQDGHAGRDAGDAIDLSGYFCGPGLINAHDHLQYALHPRLGRPPYSNYVMWGRDIHEACAETIALYNAIPRDVRLWWGGIRNLLCGVTTVCHHDKPWPALYAPGFPVNVLRRYGWAHSLAHGGDVGAAWHARPAGSTFFIHLCEGVDECARQEVFTLHAMGLLGADTALIHGLALDSAGAALLRRQQAALIVCPSSNQFLFHSLPGSQCLHDVDRLALGSDSPLSAVGDLLDEMRFAREHLGLSAAQLCSMVTTSSAEILRLSEGEGGISTGSAADLIVFRDRGCEFADAVCDLSSEDIEGVIVRGQVQLASPDLYERLPESVQRVLQPLQIGDTLRWLRAPVTDLLHHAEAALGAAQVCLGGRVLHAPTGSNAEGNA